MNTNTYEKVTKFKFKPFSTACCVFELCEFCGLHNLEPVVIEMQVINAIGR